MNMDRRDFLKCGGSLVILPGVPACSDQPQASADGNLAISNRINLDSSGSVRFYPGKVELGQGILTALTQIIAEELHVDFHRVSVIAVDTATSPNEGYTFSSISVQKSGPLVRKAAATGYQYLITRAAQVLKAGRSELDVVDGGFLINGEATGLSYWQLLEGEASVISAQQKIETTAVESYQVVGKSVPRLDIRGKVFGHASFLQDVRLDGMLHARVVHPPSPRAELIEFDSASVASLPGEIELVRDGNFVAVVAEREQSAQTAAQQLSESLRWSGKNDLPTQKNIYQWLRQAPSKSEIVVEKSASESDHDDDHKGQTDTKKFSAIFRRPYQCHASISPSAAIALYANEKLTIWSHAQGMYPLRSAIAHTLGLEKEQVRCIHREAAGCYGHNGADDAACEAAALAMHMPGRPIRLQWERHDEFRWEPYGSAMQIEVSAELGNDGKVVNWKYDLWSCTHSGRPANPEAAGNLLYAQLRENPLPLPAPRSIPQPNGGADRNAVPLYDFAPMLITKHLLQSTPLRTSALRGLGAYANVFAIESFIDELAQAADQDPIDFRLQHLSNPRAIRVLEELREASGWSKRPSAGSGIGWGMAFAQFKNISSYLSVAIKLEVDVDSGQILLKHAIAVCDAGLVINPDGLKAQIEGGIIQSASWTLKERLKFDQSGVHDKDWASYPILRFDEIPEIEVRVLNLKNEKSVGVGETAQGPTAGAIANAVFHASGQRLRSLPLTLAKNDTST